MVPEGRDSRAQTKPTLDDRKVTKDSVNLYKPNDWEEFVTGCKSCAIFCHAGCPDGLGAARLVWHAMTALGVQQLHIVELEHTDRAAQHAELFKPDAAVLYVDISPYTEDLPLLRQALKALVIDHHNSVVDRMVSLVVEMPDLTDLSCTEDNHCAASLVGREFHRYLYGRIQDLDRKIALLRKKDVWEYAIPSEWAADAEAFTAFVQKRAVCNLAMIDEFLDDLSGCLTQGYEAVTEQKANAVAVFDRIRIAAEALHPHPMVILVVEFEKEISYNAMAFLQLCRKYTSAIVMRVLHFKSGRSIDVRLSRTTEDVGDLGEHCRQLHYNDSTTYDNGGGHPFAAGLQVNTEHWNVDRIAEDLLRVAGASPETIRIRRESEIVLNGFDTEIPSLGDFGEEVNLRRSTFQQRRSAVRSQSSPSFGLQVLNADSDCCQDFFCADYKAASAHFMHEKMTARRLLPPLAGSSTCCQLTVPRKFRGMGLPGVSFLSAPVTPQTD